MTQYVSVVSIQECLQKNPFNVGSRGLEIIVQARQEGALWVALTLEQDIHCLKDHPREMKCQ